MPAGSATDGMTLSAKWNKQTKETKNEMKEIKGGIYKMLQHKTYGPI